MQNQQPASQRARLRRRSSHVFLVLRHRLGLHIKLAGNPHNQTRSAWRGKVNIHLGNLGSTAQAYRFL
jgi:hypothetical protein